MLAVLDDVHIGVVDGLFMVLDTSGPVGGRAEDLRGETGGGEHQQAQAQVSVSAEPTWTLVLTQLGTR